MAQIVIKNLFGGVIKDYVASPTNAVEGKEGQYTRTNGIDLFREGFVGHITPAQIFSTAVTVAGIAINSLPRAAATVVTQASPQHYFIQGGLSGTAPRVVRVTSDEYDQTATINAHAGHNFTTLPSGTGFWGEDIIVYRVNGTEYVFYSWNDNTDGDVGQTNLTGTYDDDFMSTSPAGAAALTTNVPHRMVEGPDKIMYITNGRYLNAFDGFIGTNGTLRTQVYDAGAGWIINDIRVDKNFLVIYMVRASSNVNPTFAGTSKIAYWQPGEIGQGIVYEFDDFFIQSGFHAFGGALVFSSGKNQTTKLSTPLGKILTEVPTGLYGTPPQPNSIELYQGNLLWIPGDSLSAFVCQYGGGFHVPYIVNDGTNNATTIGFIKNLQTNKLYAGGLFASTYKIVYLNNSGGYATSSQDLRSKLYRLPSRSSINKVTVFFSQMASGSTCRVSLFSNYIASSVGTSGTDLLANYSLANMSFASDGALTEREIACSINNISAFYINVRVAGQISVAGIVVEYQ